MTQNKGVSAVLSAWGSGETLEDHVTPRPMRMILKVRREGGKEEGREEESEGGREASLLSIHVGTTWIHGSVWERKLASVFFR